MAPRPKSFMRAATARAVRNVPVKLTRRTSSHSASFMSSARARGKIPALLTRPSGLPQARAEATMTFTLWRCVVGMVRPTRRPGTLEELIRILPEGIGIVPLLLNFKAGSKNEFLNSIPLYERFASELAEQGVDMIMLSGAPPFMLLGQEKEASLTNAWTKKFKTPVLTDPQMQVAALRAMKIKKFIGASYSALQNKIVLDYMTAAGFKALSMEPIDVPFDQVAQISVERLYAHVKRLYRAHRNADGV